MFPVPGWSVSSAALKSQTAAIPTVSRTPAPKNPNRHPLGQAAPEKDRKRKRRRGPAEVSAVTTDNVAELWETVIEGKAPSAVTAKSRREQSGAGEDGPRPKRKRGNRTNGRDSKQEKKGSRQEVDDKSSSKSKDSHTGDKPSNAGDVDTDVALASTGPLSTKPIRSKLEPQKASLAPTRSLQPEGPQLTPLQASMREKLVSARFRHINQTLYTTSSSHSSDLFRENPEMFREYHEGFRKQVEVWPENPVDGFIQDLQLRGSQRPPGHRNNRKHSKEPTSNGELPGPDAPDTPERLPLPRTEGTCTVADLGCGDAKLSQTLSALKAAKKLKLKILSYDLQSTDPLVQSADIANLPLPDSSVDVAIFCLALMGTNWIDFVEEAFRVLRWKGELWVAEIKSRFDRARAGPATRENGDGKKKKSKKNKPKLNGEDAAGATAADDALLATEVDGNHPSAQQAGETDVSAFVEVLRRRGFALDHRPAADAVDLRNKMFVKLRFVKALTPAKGKGMAPPSTGEYQAQSGGEGMNRIGGRAKLKFLERGGGIRDGGEEGIDEAGALKPCVYKKR